MTGQAKCTAGSAAAQEYISNEKKVKFEEHYNFNIENPTPKERHQDMEIIASLNNRVEKPIIAAVVSPNPELASTLTQKEWRDLAHDTAEKMGFRENQWGWCVHKDSGKEHMHIYANRVNALGKCTVQNAHIGEKMGKTMDELCKSRGWKTVEELTHDKKNHMYRQLTQATASSRDWGEVKKKLSDQGIGLDVNYATKNGQPVLNGARLWLLSEEENRRKKEAENKLSEKEKTTKLGFTLSELSKTVPKSERVNIHDLQNKLTQNEIKNERARKTEISPGDVARNEQHRPGFRR